MQAGRAAGGFATHPGAMDGRKVRERGEKFFDHFSQATLFWNSQSDPEKQHIVQALRFELGKLEAPAVRERMVGMLAQVDRTLAGQVAEGLGLAVPKLAGPLNLSVPADADPKKFQPIALKQAVGRSEALSMAKTVKDSAATRKVAILAADGVDEDAAGAMQRALLAAGAVPKIVAPHGGSLKTGDGGALAVDFTLLTVGSVLFDAVFIPGGAPSTGALAADAAAVLFVREAYKHCKAIAATGTGLAVLEAAGVDAREVLTRREGANGQLTGAFIKAIAQHRDWSREAKAQTVPA
jgi:catalase